MSIIEPHVSFVITFKELERRRRNESNKVISLVGILKSRVRLLKIKEIKMLNFSRYPLPLESLYPLPFTLYPWKRAAVSLIVMNNSESFDCSIRILKKIQERGKLMKLFLGSELN